MKILRSCFLTAAMLVVASAATTVLAAETPSVPRWQPHDFSFTTKTQPPNPFLVEFSATVKGPDGKSFTLPGFFDGKDTWKIRVSPTAPGAWSLVTKSALPELDGKTATFTGVGNPNPKIHGVLRVDKERPHHFIFEDGTHFFLQGYEYDWLWALDMDKPGVPTVEKSLDLLARHGFNYVILNSYAHDTSWRKGKTGPDDYGPPLLYAWEGTNEQPDHSRMNLAYWQHYDHLMTVHDDDQANDSGAYDELTDFRADQQHSKFRETVLRQRDRRAWPVANVESDYECGPGGLEDKTYNDAHTTDHTLRTLWQIAMAGGYTAYYYTYTAWDVVRPFDEPPGYARMKHFGDFWRSTKFWLLQPTEQISSEGWCLANEGHEYVVYLNEARPFTLDIKGATGRLTAAWFDPFAGKTTAAGSFGIGKAQCTPPAGWGSAPLVLHLRAN